MYRTLPTVQTYFKVCVVLPYTSYEGPNLPNQNCRQLWVFDRKLVGSHSIFYHYFDNNREDKTIMFI